MKGWRGGSGTERGREGRCNWIQHVMHNALFQVSGIKLQLVGCLKSNMYEIHCGGQGESLPRSLREQLSPKC